jgi:nucleoside-diphosphate-sugar epimerase
MSGKLLITGGLGNLGSWITSHLSAANYETYVLATNERELTEDINFTFLPGDITDLDRLREVFATHDFDYVIHVASVNDGFKANYFHNALQVNALGTRNLLEVIKDKPPQHLIYFSTFQVYGQYSGTITEATPTNSKNDYGNTHLFAELYLQQFHRTHDLPHTIIRLTNSYGCPKDLNSSKWYLILNDLSRTAFQDKEIVLKSNGLAPRDFIWMGTVADVVEQLLQQPPTNEVYNLSGQNTLKMLDVAEFVQDAYFQEFGERVPVRTNQEDKTVHPIDLFVDSSKLRAQVSIRDEVRFVEEARKIFQMLSNK